MKNLSRAWQRFTALIAIVLFAVPSAWSATPNVIRVAAPDLSAGAKPAYAGQVDVLYTRHLLEDEFAKDGIRVEWSFFKGAGPAINEAFANQQLDFAFLGDLPPIVGRAGGLDTRVLLALARGAEAYLAVTPQSGIKTLADLKGKRVGLLRGTADQLSFAEALASAGLGERDLRVINLDFNAVNAAFAAGQIDATWATGRLLALRDRGLAKIPLGSRDLGGAGALQGAFIGAHAFTEANPQLTVRVVKAVLRASQWLSQESNRQAQVALFAGQASYPVAVVDESLRGAQLDFFYSPLLDRYYLDGLRRKVTLARQLGLTRKTFDVDQWVDARYLQQALQELGWQQQWKPAEQYVSR
ncbi:ABC transporter substrate-binding protein [Solimonas soli]|uniref:ABC transporter substrate-binding protein n=1 Tax=Solimonas soli TaxID=413479 RepID=UPI000484F033|nr:ABC transporter substrate-binding protein [Solimonas soli]